MALLILALSLLLPYISAIPNSTPAAPLCCPQAGKFGLGGVQLRVVATVSFRLSVKDRFQVAFEFCDAGQRIL